MITALLYLSLSAGHPGGEKCHTESVIEDYFTAFNAHSVENILLRVDDDIQWFFLSGDQSRLELSGRQQLGEWLENYFRSTPGARSSLESIIIDGCLASTRERAYWQSEDGERSQTALANYQVRSGKILRIWYLSDSD